MHLIFLVTIIGFSQRSQTVSEGHGGPDVDSFLLAIDVHSHGSERRDYEVHIHVINGNATVEATDIQFDLSYDALFGSRNGIDDPIKEIRNLEAGTLQFSRELTTTIRNDIRAEGLECYTLQIRNVDAPGYRDISSCNGDDTNSSDCFCRHTICIEDDDGMFILLTLLYTLTQMCGYFVLQHSM